MTATNASGATVRMVGTGRTSACFILLWSGEAVVSGLGVVSDLPFPYPEPLARVVAFRTFKNL